MNTDDEAQTFGDWFDRHHVIAGLIGNALVALALVFLVLWSAGVLAQVVTRFPLHKPIDEPAITICRTADVLIDLNTMAAANKGADAMARYARAVAEKQCATVSGIVTYTRQAHRLDSPDGSVWTVYEANAGGPSFYVPMRGFLHEGTDL